MKVTKRTEYFDRLKVFISPMIVSLFTGGIKLLKHSRWSAGKFIPLEDIRQKWIYDDEAGDDSSNNENLALRSYPPAPNYTKHRSLGNAADRCTLEVKDNYLEMKESKKKERISRNNQRLLEKNDQETDALTASGLFPCRQCNDLYQRCMRTFSNQKNLDNHMVSGNHRYPSLTGMTKATIMAVNNTGVLSSAKFINRSTAIPRDLKLELATMDVTDSNDYCYPGCLNKPKHKKGTSMSPSLKTDLLDIFNSGQGTKAKRNALNTLNLLKSMTIIVEGVTRLKYSDADDNDHGPLPNGSQIRSFFSQESNRRKAGIVKPISSNAVEKDY